MYNFKTTVILIIFTVISINSYSQITFEQGYFIDNSGKKVFCLIKNKDWEINPTEIKYKLSENDELRTQTIKNIVEFEVDNTSKYVKEFVLMDSESHRMDELNYSREPSFQRKNVFLKVLVTGQASLLSYNNGAFTRYFIKMGENPAEQLISKSYLGPNDKIKYNNRYLQQITNSFNQCESLSKFQIENCKYSKKDLSKLFIRYNTCVDPGYTNGISKKKRDFFKLNLRPGVSWNSIEGENMNGLSPRTSFETTMGTRFGCEGEFILPFNKDKWSIIIEPTYSAFKVTQELQYERSVEFDYKSFEVSLGGRHSFFLSSNSRLFVNASYIIDVINNSAIEYSYGLKIDDLKTSGALGFGLGYAYKRLQVEFRYLTTRDAMQKQLFRKAHLDTMFLTIGYSLF